MEKKNKKKLRKPRAIPGEQGYKLRRMGLATIWDRKLVLIRLLDTAIEIWFHGADPYSVHVLACVVHNNLKVIGEPMGFVPALFRDSTPDQIYRTWDCIRHPSSDPKELLTLPQVNNQFIMWDAVDLFEKIYALRSPRMNTFGSWCTLTFRRREDPTNDFHAGLRLEDVLHLSREAFFAKMLPLFNEAHNRGLY